MSRTDSFIECPFPRCDGGHVHTNTNWTLGTDTDQPCPLCDGDGVFLTHDEVDQAWQAIGACHLCHDALEDCTCLVALLPVAPRHLSLVADQPSARERREHARVLTFPNKKTAPGWTPDAA